MSDLESLTNFSVNVTAMTENIGPFIQEMPDKIVNGDLFAILITFIVLYCAVFLLIKSAKYLVAFIKKFIIFAIFVLAVYIFVKEFLFKVLTEGFTPDVLVVGGFGLICGIIAVIVALSSVIGAHRKRKEEQAKKEAEAAAAQSQAAYASVAGSPAGYGNGIGDVNGAGGQAQYGQMPQGAYANGYPNGTVPHQYPPNYAYLPTQLSMLTTDNSIGMVIISLAVAEFGVFSSKTIATATVNTGIAFFVMFMIAALIFIKLTYHNYLTGLWHFFVAFMIGVVMTFILGYFWAGIPLETLMSDQFFSSEALVALITGLSLSLFMSGRGQDFQNS